MSEDYKEHFKEIAPEKTVKRLKAKLNELGIELNEIWMDKSYINTYSLRVEIKGTNIGTNGKGVTKEYALASAYAEFFERYQNNLLGATYRSKTEEINFYEAPDEKLCSAKEIIQEDNELIKLFIKKRGLMDASVNKQTKAFTELVRLDYLLYGLKEEYVTLPYYSMKNDRIENLPKSLISRYYGSNGMCAGNSREEALVQGFSEILERVAQRRLFLEKPILPDIPEEYIEKYPYIYKMYIKLKQCDNYEVMLKDCSFGGKYPVAALILIKKDTGCYGVKLGCHPDYKIAMERAFTEATQGNDIFLYAERSRLDFNDNSDSLALNIYNSYKIGVGQYPYQIFGTTPTYEFVPMDDTTGISNADLLKIWSQKILSDGYDILVRDNSCFGFCTYQILIPGLSEMTEDTDKMFRAYNTRLYVNNLLLNPKKITPENSKYIVACINYFKDSIMENTMSTYIKSMKTIPGYTHKLDCHFFKAMCYVLCKQYKLAAITMQVIYDTYKRHPVREENYELFGAIYQYLSGMDNIGNHNSVMKYMNKFYSAPICEELNYLFKKPEDVIINLLNKYIDLSGAKEEKIAYSKVMEALYQQRLESTIRQEDLREISSLKETKRCKEFIKC